MPADKEHAQKQCFVISPIGTEGSDDRINADWLLKGIIEPVLGGTEFNYHVRRADEGGPGRITNQIINWIFEADLVVADLTGKNENVFYELAVAHTTGKTVIPMMMGGESLPFDNYHERTIFYNRITIEGFDKTKIELAAMVRSVEDPGFKADNPVVSALGFQKMIESGDPKDKLLAELTDTIAGMRRDLDRLADEHDSSTRRSRLRDASLDKAAATLRNASIHSAKALSDVL